MLAAYGVRRATRDADVNAIATDVTPAHIRQIVRDIAMAEVDDEVEFFTDNIDVQEIREESDYPGLRVRIATKIGPWRGSTVIDVSTGDPIVPSPRIVQINRVLGEPIALLGYAPETVIAEKGVTILERGITSTRWRDYVDIVRLAHQGFDSDELRHSALVIAKYRGVRLQPVSAMTVEYGAVGQQKWAAWRRKEHLELACEENLDNQMSLVAAILDPIFDLNEK